MAGIAALTVQDIINEALGILGVYQGDPLSASDLQSAFFTFQALVDGWAGEQLTFRQVSILQFNTAAGKAAYTLAAAAGAGVDWVAPFLPMELDAVTMQMGSLELEVKLDTLRQWESIAIKSMQSSILTDVWVDLGAVSHTLNFYPVPSANIPVNLYLPQQLAKPTTPAAAIVLPPGGYQEALTYELAIKVSSRFGAAIPEWLPVAWAEAKGKVKASNFPALDMLCDPALVRRGSRMGGGSIAFYTGE